jgi:threonine dehydrogenase-like Zn-dependent dehydrogenase
MKAALLHGPADLRVVDIDTPDPEPDEVIVRVVCYAPYGTDLGAYKNEGGRYLKDYPVGIGADFSGVVERSGSAVNGFKAGDRVSALAIAHCGHCRNCRAGRTNLCLDDSFLLADRQVACQTHTRVLARKLAKLPDGVSFEDGAMLGGIVDALNAFDMMKPKVGETIAVLGVGAMGWGAVATAKAAGLTVIAVSGRGHRSQLARAVGADHLVPIQAHGEDVSAQVLALAPGGVDLAMETSATDWGVEHCFKCAGPGGRIAITGSPGQLPVSGWDLVRRELAVYGVRAGHHQNLALKLIADGKIDLKPSVTHRMPLEDASEAFKLLTGPEAKDVGRIILNISEP